MAVIDTLQLAAILVGIAVVVIPIIMLGIDWALTRPRRNTPPPPGLPPAPPAPQARPTRQHLPLPAPPTQPPAAPDTIPLIIPSNTPGRGTLPCPPIPGVTITRNGHAPR